MGAVKASSSTARRQQVDALCEAAGLVRATKLHGSRSSSSSTSALRRLVARAASAQVLRCVSIPKLVKEPEIALPARVKVIEHAPSDLQQRVRDAPTVDSLIDLVDLTKQLRGPYDGTASVARQWSADEKRLPVWVLIRLTKLLQQQNASDRNKEHSAQLLQLMLPHIQRDLHTYNSSALSILTFALGTLGYDQFGLAPQIMSLARQEMRAFHPEGLSKLLWGLAVLKQEPDEEWMEAALQAVVYSRTFDGTSCVRLLQALAMLNYAPAKPDMDIILSRIKGHLAYLKPVEMAIMMWALARLRSQPSHVWLQEFYTRSRRKLSGCSGGELSAFASAIMILRYIPDAWWIEEFLKQSLLRLQWCTCSEAVDLLCSVCQFNFQPSKVWLQHCLQHLHNVRSQLTCRQLIAITYALSLLPSGHPTILQHRRWLSECMLQLQHRLSSLHPAMLAKALSGGVKLKLSLGTDWIEECYDVLDNCLTSLNAPWVAHIIHVMGSAKRTFNPLQTAAWLERTQTLVPNFSVEDMLMILVGLAKLDLGEEECLHVLTSLIADRLCSQDVTDLAMCVRTLEMHRTNELPEWYFRVLASVKRSLATKGRLRSSFGYFREIIKELS